jgi:hypothetical protein
MVLTALSAGGLFAVPAVRRTFNDYPDRIAPLILVAAGYATTLVPWTAIAAAKPHVSIRAPRAGETI